MSTLTSSAVGGRKAPPRAPPRRRAVPTPNDREVSQAQTNIPEASRTLTGPGEQPDASILRPDDNQFARRPPSPPVVVERPLTTARTKELAQTPSERIAQTSEDASPLRRATPQPIADGSTLHAVVAPSTADVPSGDTERTRKRPNIDTTHAESAPPVKRTRTSTRARAAPHDGSEPQSISGQPGHSAAETVSDSSTLHDGHARSSTRSRTTTQRGVPSSGNVTMVPSTGAEVHGNGSVDPAIVAGQTAELSTSQVASNLASQVQESVEASAARPKPRRQRRKKPMLDGDGTVEQDASTGEPMANPNESHTIDSSTLSMFELSHDTKHGKTSEREKKMAKIDWTAVARKRREEADAIAQGELQPEQEGQHAVASTEGDDGVARQAEGETRPEQTDTQTAAQPEPITRATGGGVRFRIVAGQLVEDEASLTIDRAARVAQAAAETAGEPVEEENDLTIRFNRTTYINSRKRDPTERVPLWRSKSDAWTEEDTDRFYDALRMFGTDFFIISKMFPPRTRKQIKLKFVREERLEPDRINAALLGRHTRRIDLDHYAQAINRDVADFHKYDGLEHATEVIRESMKDKEEAMRAAVKEEEENNRQRDAQRQQREKQRIEADKKKEERAKKKAMSRRGYVFGAGTLGGAEDEHDDFQNE